MHNDYKTNLQTFFFRVMGVIKGNEGVNRPSGVLIIVGEANLRKIEWIRERSPLPLFILYIYVAASSEQEKNFLEKADKLSIVAIPLLEEPYLPDKVGMLIALFPNVPRQMMVEAEIEDQFSDLIRAINMAIEAAIDMQSQIAMRGLVWLRSAIANLGFILKAGKFVDKLPQFQKPPIAVVCGAGPSLADDLELLKQYKKNLLLISVGHAFPILHAAGIAPDIVVEIDSYVERNWENFKGAISEKTLLVATPDVAYEVPPLFKKHLWVSTGYAAINDWFNLYGIPLPQVHIDKTVSIVAIDFAVRLGIKNIILLGQDMAVDDEGRLHLDDVPATSYESLTLVEGYNGKKVYATDSLIALRKSMELYFADLAVLSPQVNVINCSKRGAIIRGITRDDFKNISKLIEKDPAPLTQIEFSEKEIDINRVESLLKRQKEIFNKVAEKNGEVVKIIQDLEQYAVLDDQKIGWLYQAMHQEAASREGMEERLFIMPIFQSLSFIDYTINSNAFRNDFRDQLIAIKFFYSLLRDALLEVKKDIEQILEKNVEEKRTLNPKVFEAFSNYACNLIGRKNPEFANWLVKNHKLDYNQEEFSVRWQQQYLPFVLMRDGADKWMALSSSKVPQWGNEVVEDFVKCNRYNPDNDAVVFWIGCNWAHICAFAKRFQFANMLVLEPYVELFSYIIRRGLFLYFLPINSIIIGIHNELKNSLELYNQEIERWKSERKRILLFEHPVLKGIKPLPPQFAQPFYKK